MQRLGWVRPESGTQNSMYVSHVQGRVSDPGAATCCLQAVHHLEAGIKSEASTQTQVCWYGMLVPLSQNCSPPWIIYRSLNCTMFYVYDLEVFCCLVTRHLTRVLIGVRDADGQMLTFVGSVDKPGANYLRSLDSVQCKSDSKLKNNNRKKNGLG